ncbi:family 78 glycoside hydrolase catalytic domain [Streptomyces sp. NBC_01476]|uniref:family 78 glycoside hydrolase catalytic domain n=1 Tax=Streptomyces sp. NBC_01476 TaxID=2903881 RepID=UPI002E381F95|nr:family 78 glycoside hydrolase catalytic domain [Streptomyces sp. NBC_01476]
MAAPGQRRGKRKRAVVLAAFVATALAVPTVATAEPSHQGGGSGTPLAPAQLRADGQASDVLLDRTRPTFAWTVRDTGRAEAQTAYEIRVQPRPAGRDDHRAAGWDSGRVRSANSTDVAYAGPALVSDHTYTWSVRTWNKQGKASPWSAPASFDTGLLNASDWSAWWLRTDDGALTRGDFDVSKPVARARLYFGAQGIAEPHLNGARVEPSEVLDSSVTDYNSRVLYRGLDVTGQLHKGRNTLALMTAKGQFSGQPVVIAQIDVTYTDGSTATFGTGPSWKTSAGPVTGEDFWYGETYDARKAAPGWDTTGYDDSSWAPVHALFPAAHPRSLAQGKPVTALDTTTTAGWSPAALTDGVDASTDASEGYHSAIESTPDTTKWVQTDLGSDQKLRTIRLFPARPTNDTGGDFPGAGFPVRYKVQVSDDPSFATATTVADRTGADQPNPGTSPVDISTDVTGRYLRVTVTELRCIGTSCTFRLAELGAYGAHSTTVLDAMTDLRADVSPPARVVQTLKPVKETRPAAGKRVYDFGQNHTGWATLQATAPAGTKADITQGEILDANGNVSTTNISFSASDPPRQTNHYTFSGAGTETYTPHFTYAGFRYAELSGLPDDAKVTVTAQVVHTDVPTTGQFSTSNPLLNKIQDAVTQTQLNDLESIPMDCPTRERHGWLGDAGDSDQEAMSNFDMQSFYDKWLGDIVTSANADGSLPSVAPTNGSQGWATDPAWGSAYPQIIWDSYTQYGSKQPITDNYSQVKAWVDYLATISDTDHIVVGSPTSWGDDWLASVSTPHSYYQTLFYYLDANLLAKMAAVTGHTADAAHYSALADQVRTGFLKRYFNAATGVFGNGSQLSYAMPLVLGLVPAGHEQTSLDRLVQDIAAHGNHVTTGFVGTTYVFQALGAFHRNDVALAIAERDDAPSFGYMVEQGPGTIWEKWPNSTAPDGTSSKDHIGLGGSIGQWYYQQLAGIQPGTSGSGYSSLTLAPSVVGDLTHVTAEQQTVRGTVKSSWQRDGSTLTYHAVVPVGATATIELPLLGGTGSTVKESGHTLYAGGRHAQSAPGLTTGKATDRALTLTAGSGDYTFTVTAPRTPVSHLSVTAGTASSVKAGSAADVSAVIGASSTTPGSAELTAQLPAGWTATTTPARIPLTPAPTETLATVRISVPADATGGDYDIPLKLRAPDGTVATTTAHLSVFGNWPAGTTVTASSFHAPNVVDGATRTYDPANAIDGNTATFWNDDTDSVYPDTLTLTTPSPVTLGSVALISFPDGVPTDFTVQSWDGTQWTTRATVSGNTAVTQRIPFTAPVTTTQLRVVVTGAQNSFTRIAELAP